MSARRLEVTSPYTREVVGSVPVLSSAEVAGIVEAAAAQRFSFSRYDRAQILESAARTLEARKGEISELITAESGLSKKDTVYEVGRACDVFNLAARLVLLDDGEAFACDLTHHGKQRRIFTTREPLRGVISAITPFNHPLNQVAHKVAPSIATNNKMVLKPSEKTPLSALLLADVLYEAGLPRGMFTVVTGIPSEIGDVLITHPSVELVTFTGGVAIGKMIAAKAGYRRIVLELGGNDPLIVMDDADLDLATTLAVQGSYKNSGQRCTAVKRMLVHRSVADAFVEGLVAKTKAVKYGDPRDPATDMGTVIDEAAARQIEARVADAIERGAALKIGHVRDGALYAPTVIDEVRPEWPVVKEETFGPVSPVIRFDGIDEAIRISNSTAYGLSAGVCTNRMDHVLRFVRELQVGTVNVNEVPGYRTEMSPFGGIKDSGLGYKEGVLEAMKSFTNLKTFSLPWATLLVLGLLCGGSVAAAQSDEAPPEAAEVAENEDTQGDRQAGELTPEEEAALAEAEVQAALAEMEAPRIETGVRGRVTDAATGEPLIEAPVIVVGTRHRTLTDLDGYFAIELPPGTYTLRSYYDLYQPFRLEGVVVRRGEATTVEAALSIDASVGEEIVITTRADTSTEAGLLLTRRQSASVMDAISAQEIRRSPDVTAGDSVRRIVGVSLWQNRYAFVRGLGGRYVTVLLNGAPLPWTDPDIPGVQLDLLPVSLLNSMQLYKTATPDLPSDFAGGLLDISSRQFPTRFTLTGNVSIGMDSLTHNGTQVYGYRGGGLDWLGVDDGSRALPSSVPQVRLEPRRGLTRDQIADIARTFPNTWNVTRETPLPNLGLQATLGDTVHIGGVPLGFLLNATYDRSTFRVLRELRTLGSPAPDGSFGARDELEIDSTQELVRLSLLGTGSLQPAPGHEIGLVGLYTQSTLDLTSVRTGRSENEAGEILDFQQQFVQRGAAFGQLTGDHRLPLEAQLRWQGYVSYGLRNEPDYRVPEYLQGASGEYQIQPGSDNLTRIYSDLSQVEGGGRADLSIPIERLVTIHAGGFTRVADRRFNLRRFTYRDGGNVDPSTLGPPPERFFDPSNIGDGMVELEEYTNNEDSYYAQQQLFAGYARVDVTPIPELRIVGGARVEGFRQYISAASPFGGDNAEPDLTDRTDVDGLPSGSITWAITPEMNLRASYSMTVGRPLLRELAPYLYYDYQADRSFQGNPALRSTTIHNADLRWEWFLGATDLIAVSAFYKRFVNPIEPSFIGTIYTLTPVNVDGADNVGGEVEVRLGLGRLHEALEAFSVSGNLTLLYSRVTLSGAQAGFSNSSERPLVGQSPYLGNVMVAFEPEHFPLQIYLYYNVFGPRIAELGQAPTPDRYQEALHSLDAVVAVQPVEHLSIRLSARNLLHQPQELITQGGYSSPTVPLTSFSLQAALAY